jgi:hypothetical protein
MVFENDFINKAAELQKLTQEVRQDAINFLNEKLGYVRKIDLTDNNVIITYNGDETYVYEVYLSPNNTLMIDTERFGSILLENLRLPDDVINIALEVHEIMII